jgi:DNA helicase-2/ATP-dependent DNA helicase PcrA
MDLSFIRPSEIQEAKDFLQKLGLKDNDTDTRANILSCWESVDIPACPGSGKTTILVAKLAWAIEHWKTDSIGICVLSHTNVAKEEIEKRLTSNQVGKLLKYPHFVGTIHEFFNKFLALPWLKARNIPVRYIDNELGYQKCSDAIWQVGKKEEFDKKYKNKFLAQNYAQSGKLTKLSWSFEGNENFQLLDSTDKFQEFQRLIKRWSTDHGYHTHDDMVAFSRRLLSEYLELPSILSARFPLVLIDEAQDTNESQSKLLSNLFDPQKTIVQRFGDNDQQIFNFGEKAKTDVFPARHKNQLILNETQRCSTSIRSAASKFAHSGLEINSVAGNKDVRLLPHLILFNFDTVTQVIPKFAELVQNNVKLREGSVIKVVGQIGKAELDDSKFPQTICHYDPTYIKPANIRLGRPKNLNTLLENTKTVFSSGNENYNAINIFFSGIIRLLADELKINFGTPYPFRKVKEELGTERMNANGLNGNDLLNGLLKIYIDVIMNDFEPSKAIETIEELLNQTGFKNYSKSFLVDTEAPTRKASQTIYVNGIPIELNTIAGVKGETHIATLVLETFFHNHNIENAIKTMFSSSKKDKDNERTQKKIKHLYVAMTRATDFLCLSLPKNKHDELCGNSAIKNWFDESFVVIDIT